MKWITISNCAMGAGWGILAAVLGYYVWNSWQAWAIIVAGATLNVLVSYPFVEKITQKK